MKTYDPSAVRITIGGGDFSKGLMSLDYEDGSPPVVVDSLGRVRGTVVTGRRRGASSGGYLIGTARWLAESLRLASPEPLLIVIDYASGDGIAHVTIAPDREGALDDAAIPALRAAVIGGLTLGVDLRITARTRAELVSAAGARVVLDWMIRRARRRS